MEDCDVLPKLACEVAVKKLSHLVALILGNVLEVLDKTQLGWKALDSEC